MPSTPIKLPNIGDFSDVEIIEVLINEGDVIGVDQTIVTLESKKASMEIPSPVAGKILAVKVKVGDKITEGDEIAICDSVSDVQPATEPKPAEHTAATAPTAPTTPTGEPASVPSAPPSTPPSRPAPAQTRGAGVSLPSQTPRAGVSLAPTPLTVYASPSVRKLARGLGVDLSNVAGSGSQGRILQEDVHNYVRTAFSRGVGSGSALFEGIEPLEPIDFSEFGEVGTEKLTRINQLTALAMSRSWLVSPHVTQFDEANIDELETKRKQLNRDQQDVKYTFLAFLVRAVVAALQEMPRVNASLNPDKKSLSIKRYYNIGIAVDTPNGLVVPVLHHADQMTLKEIAKALIDIGGRARDRKLGPKYFKGGTFTITSLGGIGGTAFTPIINQPEVAILGVSRSQIKPVWEGEKFIPQNRLPLCLSYDHRVIDGALAARFTTLLGKILSDPKPLMD